jgi:hypothetical protein
MFRFDQLIRSDMIVRDVRLAHPETEEVFEQLGFRRACDECDIETGARRSGVNVSDALEALNRAAFGPGSNSQNI